MDSSEIQKLLTKIAEIIARENRKNTPHRLPYDHQSIINRLLDFGKNYSDIEFDDFEQLIYGPLVWDDDTIAKLLRWYSDQRFSRNAFAYFNYNFTDSIKIRDLLYSIDFIRKHIAGFDVDHSRMENNAKHEMGPMPVSFDAKSVAETLVSELRNGHE